MQNIKMYAPVSLRIAWKAWEKTTHKQWNDSHFASSFQACKHTFFLNLLLLLPDALELLMY